MPSIQALSSAVLDAAKVWIRRRTFFHTLTFLFAASGIIASGGWLYGLACLAALSEMAAWASSLATQSKKALGQELLRHNILKTSFGNGMVLDASYLKGKVDKKDREKAKRFEKDDYYGTSERNSENRLIQILQESCFWSHHLYRSSRDRAAIIASSLILLVIISVALTLPLTEIDQQYTEPRLVLLFMIFFPIWDEMGKVISFNNASNRLELIDTRLSSNITDIAGVLAIFADYNVVTASAPLIPQKIYDKKKDVLNGLWAERQTDGTRDLRSG